MAVDVIELSDDIGAVLFERSVIAVDGEVFRRAQNAFLAHDLFKPLKKLCVHDVLAPSSPLGRFFPSCVRFVQQLNGVHDFDVESPPPQTHVELHLAARAS